MDGSTEVQCPYCGEIVDIDVDEGGSRRQTYVEDCPVCCRPWRVDARRDRDGGWIVDLHTEND